MFDDVNKNSPNSNGQPLGSSVKPKTAGASPPPGLPTTEEVSSDISQPEKPSAAVGEFSTEKKPAEVEDMLEGTDSASLPNYEHKSEIPKSPPAFKEAPPAFDSKEGILSNNTSSNFPGTDSKVSVSENGDLPPLTPGTPPPVPPEDLVFTNDNMAGKKKMLVIGIVIVALLLLLVGGYLVYQNFVVQSASETVTENVKSEPQGENQPKEKKNTDEQVIPDDKVLDELPTDTDGDGLTDEEEKKYNTDPTMADTDQDGLFDREEVITWKTDPLNPDTDGDSYLDGEEVKNGFNPLGPGKLDYYPFVE